MEIINVIVTDMSNGNVISINSFGIIEPQLSDEVTKKAEQFFIRKCTNNGVELDEVENCLEDGYCEIEDENCVVTIVWGSIDN